MNTTRKYKLTRKFERLVKEEETKNLALNAYIRLCVNIYEDLVKTDEMIDVKPSSREFTDMEFGRLYRDLWTEEPEDIRGEIKTMIYNLEMEGLIEGA